MAKNIRISNEAHEVLRSCSELTGASIGEIVDRLVVLKTQKEIIKSLFVKMNEVK